MFRYISLGTSARVPRDLISDTLRMVSCHHKATAASEPVTGNGEGRGESPSSFHSVPSFPFLFPSLTFFTLALRDGWDQGVEKHVFLIYFQNNKTLG
jgi:hypothetical protein